MKSLGILLLLTLISSCSTISDVADLVAPVSPESTSVLVTKDMMTNDLKYTPQKMAELFESQRPVITPEGNGQFRVTNAIKVLPYVIQSKNDVGYYFELSITGSKELVSKELMMKCGDYDNIAHKFSNEEIEARNVIEHSVDVNKNKVYYQEEVLQTKVDPLFFNYLKYCKERILMRAKGPKSSIDSSIQQNTKESDILHKSMFDLEAKVLEASKKE